MKKDLQTLQLPASSVSASAPPCPSIPSQPQPNTPQRASPPPSATNQGTATICRQIVLSSQREDEEGLAECLLSIQHCHPAAAWGSLDYMIVPSLFCSLPLFVLPLGSNDLGPDALWGKVIIPPIHWGGGLGGRGEKPFKGGKGLLGHKQSLEQSKTRPTQLGWHSGWVGLLMAQTLRISKSEVGRIELLSSGKFSARSNKPGNTLISIGPVVQICVIWMGELCITCGFASNKSPWEKPLK